MQKDGEKKIQLLFKFHFFLPVRNLTGEVTHILTAAQLTKSSCFPPLSSGETLRAGCDPAIYIDSLWRFICGTRVDPPVMRRVSPSQLSPQEHNAAVISPDCIIIFE